MKAMVCLPDSETEFFDIITRVLQEDRLAPFLFKICFDYILWKSIDLWQYSSVAVREGLTKKLSSQI